jgi:hypothetical protein
MTDSFFSQRISKIKSNADFATTAIRRIVAQINPEKRRWETTPALSRKAHAITTFSARKRSGGGGAENRHFEAQTLILAAPIPNAETQKQNAPPLLVLRAFVIRI